AQTTGAWTRHEPPHYHRSTRLLPAPGFQTTRLRCARGLQLSRRAERKKWQAHLIAQRAQALESKRDASVMPAMIKAEKLNFAYKVTGANEQLRPLRVFDGGAKTYIQMRPEIQNTEAPVLV